MRKALKNISWLLCCALLLTAITACSKENNNKDSQEQDLIADEILAQHNLARTKPQNYADRILKPYMENLPEDERATAQELYDELMVMRPLKPLALDDLLTRSAQWLANDQKKSGKTGHSGSDNSTLQQRLIREGANFNYMGENCAYGPTQAQGIVLLLLIDHGVDSRGHRRNILNANYTHLGVGFARGDNAPYGCAVVIDYGGK